KKLTIPLACIAGFALAVSQASAALIVNGNFELGNAGFTSGYTFDNSANGLAGGGEDGFGAGKYSVVNNPNSSHSAFVSVGDHTTGSALMMVVNGSTVANKNVWSGTVAPPLILGTTYQFSA